MKKCRILAGALLCASFATSASAATWYVRLDGGARWSTNMTDGQRDRLSEAAYPGKGVNQHCAWKDVRSLYADGSYTSGDSFPGWGWVGQGRRTRT